MDHQKPSIGRIVHFFWGPGDAPHAAIITRVHSERCVNLTVFPDGGEPQWFSSVEEVESGQSNDRRWMWPPRV